MFIKVTPYQHIPKMFSHSTSTTTFCSWRTHGRGTKCTAPPQCLHKLMKETGDFFNQASSIIYLRVSQKVVPNIAEPRYRSRFVLMFYNAEKIGLVCNWF